MGSMPVFNGDGPVAAEALEDPVDVSSGDSSEEKEGGEREEGADSEAESRAPPPPAQVPHPPPLPER